MQASYKILINSLYGMMGTKGLNYNDYPLADKITGIARQIIRHTIRWATGEDINYWWADYDLEKDQKYEGILNDQT